MRLRYQDKVAEIATLVSQRSALITEAQTLNGLVIQGNSIVQNDNNVTDDQYYDDFFQDE